MLLLHETHEVVGTHEEAFEALMRDEWMPRLAAGDDARLLYFLHHAHGTGASYQVVTWTALAGGAAWERLAGRVDAGDLQDLAQRLDGLRHDVFAKLLIPLPWSPLQELELGEVPTGAESHPLSVFMEDTVWPHEGSLERYVQRSGSHYAAEMAQRGDEGAAILRIQAAFRTAFGSHRRREIVLWQKVTKVKALTPLIAREVPVQYRQPGTWMHDALELRDRWESRLLRSSDWSPWY